MYNVVKNLYDIFIQCPERTTISLAYKFKNLHEKLARHKNHLTFLIHCRNHNVVPQAFCLSMSFVSDKVRRILQRSGKAILRECILRIKESLQKQLDQKTDKIRKLPLSYYERELILEWAEYYGAKTFNETKRRHISKFQQLTDKRHQQNLHPPTYSSLKKDCLVINLSKTKLTKEQQAVLELGLNLASTPQDIPRNEIIARTERSTGLA